MDIELFNSFLININLTVFILALSGVVYFWHRTKSLYFVPISIYIINLIILYLAQMYYIIPSDAGKIWSMCSRLFEGIIIIGSMIIYYREQHDRKV